MCSQETTSKSISDEVDPISQKLEERRLLRMILYECFRVHHGHWVCTTCVYTFVARCISKLKHKFTIDCRDGAANFLVKYRPSMNDLQDLLEQISEETKQVAEDKHRKWILVCTQPASSDENSEKLYCVLAARKDAATEDFPLNGFSACGQKVSTPSATSASSASAVNVRQQESEGFLPLKKRKTLSAQN